MYLKGIILSLMVFALSLSLHTSSQAAEVGGINFSDNAFADSIASSDFTGGYGSAYGEILSTWEEALIGSNVYTWMEYGEHDLLPGEDGDYNSTAPPSQFVELNFTDNAVYNGPSADLIIFEYGDVNSVLVALDLYSLQNPYDPLSKVVVVTPVAVQPQINAGYVDLSGLGVAWGESINSVFISSALGENGEVYWGTEPNWGVPEVSAVGALYTEELSLTQQLDLRISNGSNDVEQLESGEILFNSSDLELVDDLTGGGNQTVGLRFTGVDIPYGAYITNAYLEFETDEAYSGATSLVVRVEDSDDAIAFSQTVNNVSSRLYAVPEVLWDNVEGLVSSEWTPSDSRLIEFASICSRPCWLGCWWGNSVCDQWRRFTHSRVLRGRISRRHLYFMWNIAWVSVSISLRLSMPVPI
ncbi:hypothetical protein [uncultured Desulfuromusa sp.]|uniref:hypothetical protein n=1 Tax=uncultured Desulfuromusa sp. TaxID=219183 RepID=UPI002AA94336|nr:hypothetical protein [uncultured Desulfuromusa sp.]